MSLDEGEFDHDGGSPARFIKAACPIDESVDEDDTFLELAKFVDDSDDDREIASQLVLLPETDPKVANRPEVSPQECSRLKVYVA